MDFLGHLSGTVTENLESRSRVAALAFCCSHFIAVIVDSPLLVISMSGSPPGNRTSGAVQAASVQPLF